MRDIFGPVASRRFGRSLGIDLSPQSKQCNFNCVYCELGAGKTPLRKILAVKIRMLKILMAKISIPKILARRIPVREI